jgi:1,2-diacylglycerol 3-alpha-glucosyltransferase
MSNICYNLLVRIAFFTDVLLPPLGGIEQHVLTTSQALARSGNEVRVYYPKPLLRKSETSDTKQETSYHLRPVAGIPMPFIWPNFSFSFPLDLYFELKKWKPDVVHFHASGPVTWAAIILSKLLKIKLVGTFHSYLMEAEYLGNFGNLGDFWTRIISRFLWWYVNCVFNCCDVVISPSEWVAKDIRNHGIHKPIKVVHNGADLTEFGKTASEAVVRSIRGKYNLGENVLLYVGRLSREKGLDILLRAICLLRGQNPWSGAKTAVPNASVTAQRLAQGVLRPLEADGTPSTLAFEHNLGTRTDDQNYQINLLLVGDGPAEGELKKFAKELGILDNIVFVGRVNHQDLPGSGLYEVSKAFVTASASENQPLTIIEAMAKRLPIIGVSARGVTELINGNGLLALTGDKNDLANKIYQLISDETSRKKMSIRSAEMSQDYSLTKATGKLLELYREAVSKK